MFIQIIVDMDCHSDGKGIRRPLSFQASSLWDICLHSCNDKTSQLNSNTDPTGRAYFFGMNVDVYEICGVISLDESLQSSQRGIND